MGIEFNGNGNVSSNLFINGGIKPQQIGGKEQVEINTTDNKAIGEFGDKLLEQVQPRFVQTSKIPDTDQAELTEMFAMAGIENTKMPTKAQYERVENEVEFVTHTLDIIRTEDHAYDLFKTSKFAVLNDIFKIS